MRKSLYNRPSRSRKTDTIVLELESESRKEININEWSTRVSRSKDTTVEGQL